MPMHIIEVEYVDTGEQPIYVDKPCRICLKLDCRCDWETDQLRDQRLQDEERGYNAYEAERDRGWD